MGYEQYVLPVGYISDRKTICILNSYWRDQRYDYTGTELTYRGVHYRHEAPTDETDWEIWKFTWSNNNLVRMEGPLKGAWDSRASLDWA